MRKFPVLRQGVSINKNIRLGGIIRAGFGTIIESNVVIGKDSSIGLYCYLGKDITLGDRCLIRDYCRLEGNATIGNRVHIYQYANIGYGSIIEDDVYIGARSMLTNTRNIQHIRGKAKIEPVTIKRGSRLAVHSVILPGVTIGEQSLIGAGAIVTKDTKPFGVYFGNPARYVRDVSESEIIHYD